MQCLSSLSSCVCVFLQSLCVSYYRDDGRWHVYTQSADSATVTLTINCLFPPCVYVCVCEVQLMACGEQQGKDTAGFT